MQIISKVARAFHAPWGSRSLSNVGLVGLGNMGRPMAQNLLKGKFSLVVYDVSDGAVADIEKLGAKRAANPAEVAASTEVCITMLPTNNDVLNCYTGPKGVLEGAKKSTILVDSSTVDPAVAQEINLAASKQGVKFFDAPVSGGTIGAEAGTLTFMVGGDESAYKSITPALNVMGANIVYCGPSGAGQAAKICNNMLLGITMLGVSEALNLGRELGLDPKMLSSIINSSTGKCWSSEKYNPVPGVMDAVPSANNYDGGFQTQLMCKDMGLAQDISTRLKCPTPLGSAAHQFYRLVTLFGDGRKDFGYVYQYLKGKK